MATHTPSDGPSLLFRDDFREGHVDEFGGLAVKHDDIDVTHKDAYVAIRDVFEAAQRRLDELVRRRRDSRRMARTSALSLRHVAY